MRFRPSGSEAKPLKPGKFLWDITYLCWNLTKKQLLTYLRLADKRLGLLINFQVALIKDGITRIVNGLDDDSHAKPQSRQDA
jgi:plasmid maintenance system antidote protein VapI